MSAHGSTDLVADLISRTVRDLELCAVNLSDEQFSEIESAYLECKQRCRPPKIGSRHTVARALDRDLEAVKTAPKRETRPPTAPSHGPFAAAETTQKAKTGPVSAVVGSATTKVVDFHQVVEDLLAHNPRVKREQLTSGSQVDERGTLLEWDLSQRNLRPLIITHPPTETAFDTCICSEKPCFEGPESRPRSDCCPTALLASEWNAI